jgi:hypothetical protein
MNKRSPYFLAFFIVWPFTAMGDISSRSSVFDGYSTGALLVIWNLVKEWA